MPALLGTHACKQASPLWYTRDEGVEDMQLRLIGTRFGSGNVAFIRTDLSA